MPPLCHVSHIWHSCVSVSQYPNPVIVACRLHRALRWPGHLLPLNRCEGFDPPAAPSSYLIPSLYRCTRYCCYLDLSQQFPWTDLPSFVFGKCSSCVLSSAVVSVVNSIFPHRRRGIMYIQKCVCTFLIVLLYSYTDAIFKKNVQFLLGAFEIGTFHGRVSLQHCPDVEVREGKAFKRQHWGNVWETGSAYALFRAHRYYIELNKVGESASIRTLLFG